MKKNNTELIIYQTEDGQTKIDVRMENETVWLSLDQMAELFQRDKSTVSRHLSRSRERLKTALKYGIYTMWNN